MTDVNMLLSCFREKMSDTYRHIRVRFWPDKPPGAIYCTLGLPSASLGRLTRLALGKPRVQ